jgi:lipid-A-disaccharide synthase
MTLIYLVAGEQSGDVLGARLMKALRAQRPGLAFCGVGGPRMIAEGLETLFPMRELAVMGLLEVLPNIRRLRRLLLRTKDDVLARKPDLLITIDSPGFTLRLLRQITDAGSRVKRIHYVAPQVWAWREKRVKEFPGLWNRLLCLLPFEPAFFARHNLPARFVGHPVLESGAGDGDGAAFRARHAIAAEAPVLILMPGSRRSEVGRLLPIFGRALELLSRDIPGLVAVLPIASMVSEQVTSAVAGWTIKPLVITDLADKHDAYAAAAAALVKSGTSTLELALANVPMVVTYRVNPVTAIMARWLLHVRYAAMVNLLADRELVPELLQGDCTPERIAKAVRDLLNDPSVAQRQRRGFREVLGSLEATEGTPSEAAALAALEVLEG